MAIVTVEAYTHEPIPDPSMKRNKLLARFLALHGVRNSELENLHAGTVPFSERGDYSDVKVITPHGEIPWTELSRISDREMRVLMLDIEKRLSRALEILPKLEIDAGSKTAFERDVHEALFKQGGATWDRPEGLKFSETDIDR